MVKKNPTEHKIVVIPSKVKEAINPRTKQPYQRKPKGHENKDIYFVTEKDEIEQPCCWTNGCGVCERPGLAGTQCPGIVQHEGKHYKPRCSGYNHHTYRDTRSKNAEARWKRDKEPQTQ